MSVSIASVSSSTTDTTGSYASSSAVPSQTRAWCLAEKLSEAFCEGVEKRFSCVTGRVQEEFDHDVAGKISGYRMAKQLSVSSDENDNLNGSNFIEAYKSKVMKGRKIKNGQLANNSHGNHRGWGSGNRKQKHILMNAEQDDHLTDEDETYDSVETYENTLSEGALNNQDTFDYTYDEMEEIRSYRHHLENGSTFDTSVMSVSSTSATCVASANDSRNDSLIKENDQYDNSTLERELPSFGSKRSKKLSRSFASYYSSARESAAFVGEPVQKKECGKLASATISVRPTSFSPGEEVLEEIEIQNGTKSQSVPQTVKKETEIAPVLIMYAKYPNNMMSKSFATNKKSEQTSKKISLGKNRNKKAATLEKGTNETKEGINGAVTLEAIKSSPEIAPRTFPYVVNHSLFHQNHNMRKARLLQARSGE